MARVKLTRQWPDESALVLEVSCADSYPDSVAEAVAAVLRMDRAAVTWPTEVEGE